MTQTDAALAAQIKDGAQPGASVTPGIPGAPGTSPSPAVMTAEQVEALASSIGRNIAEQFKEIKGENTRKEPPPDHLQKAIDALPEEHRASAEVLKPILEKIQSQAREGLISKEEAETMAKTAAEDAVNIQHFEVWKESMAKEWDGKEGKPLFDFTALDKFMREHEYSDPEDAFYLMNREALTRYEASHTAQPKAGLDKGGAPAPKPADTIPVNLNDAYAYTAGKAAQRLKEAGF